MGTPLRVLIVEDSEEDTLLIVRELKRGGFDPIHERVETAEAMSAALAKQTWDLIISDYVMPRFNGLGALKLLQRSGIDLPFIIVSGNIGEEIAVATMKAGAHDYLMKNNLSRLVPAVGQELREAEVRRKLKHSEKALQESEKRYRELVENAAEIIYAVDEKGNFTYANPAGLKVTGYSLQELRSFNYADLVLPDHRERVSQIYVNQFRERLPATYVEFPFLSKTGEIIWFSQNSSLVIEDGKVVGFHMIARDITERKKAEKALRESEREKAAILNGVSELITYQDRELRVIWANRAAGESVGISPEKLVGRHCYEIWQKRSKPCADCPVVKCFATGQVHQAEMATPDGKIWFIRGYPALDEKGSVIGTTEITLEITERRHAEEALRHSEERFRLSFEDANIGMCLVDLSGRLTRVNQKMCEIFGYTRKELEGMTVNDIAHPEDLNVSPKFIDRAISGEVEHAIFEKRYFHKYGHIVYGQVSSSLVRDAQGVPQYFISHVQEITERKKAEESLKQSEENARQFAQENAAMAEIGRIISSTLNIEEVYERFVEEVRKLFPVDRIMVNILNPEDRTITMAHVFGVEVAGRRQGDVIPSTDPFLEDLIAGRSSILIQTEDESELAERYPILLSTFRAGLRSMMSIPLISKDQVIGLLHFRSTKPNAYSEKDLRLAERVGNQIAGAIANAQLFSERKRAEEALKESEEKFRALFEQAAVGVAQIETETGRFLSINPRYCEIVGYTIQEMQNLSFREITHPEDLQADLDNAKLLIEGKIRESSSEKRYYHKNGSIVWVNLTVSPMWAVGEKTNYHIAVVQDITERKRIEEALQMTQFSVERAPESVIWIDSEGHLDYVNEAACRSLGYAREELLSMSIWHIDPGFPQERWSTHWQELPKPGPSTRESHHRTKEGKIFPVEITGDYLKYGDKEYHVIFARDITERKRAEEALRSSEEKYRTILETIEEGYFEVDISGNFTFFNDSLCKIIGYLKDEMMGMNNRQYMDKENAKKVYQTFNQVYTTGEPHVSFDWEIIKKDGTKRFIESSVSLIRNSKSEQIGFRGVVRDITERKKAEEALRESEERFRELYDNAPVGYFEYDSQGHITSVNRTELEMSGYIFEEMIGQPVWEFIEEGIARQQILAKLAGTMPPARGLERTYRRKDGTTFPGIVEDRLILDSEGKIKGIRATIQDITERMRAEEEKAALQEQLRQSQKMEAIGQLAGGVAHDFNNLLTVIKGYSQLSLAEMKKEEPLRENIEEIKKSADRAADLTRQLLAFSRRQVMEMRVLDLNDLLRNLDKMLQRVIGEDIELATILDENLGKVKADPGQIEQVIMNLAVNARDAMSKGGKLTIETANVDLDQAYARAHVAVKPGPYVMISASDTGVGMEPEIRDRIFEPFFTTKEKGRGTGLGLSTVYGIVKQSGGNIWVYSEPEKGTTFKIYLPRVDEPFEELKEKLVKEELPRGNETILIVEDEEDVLKLAGRILSRQGYHVLEASGGEEALRICKKRKEPFRLLLTDVVMPQMSGRQLEEQLSRVCQDFKVLYMSGYTDNAITHHGVLEKGLNYIQKPFTVESLIRKVREVLDK